MRILNLLAFDETIAGTAGTWYTPDDLNQTLGQAEYFGIQAYTTGVSGSAPSLTIDLEHSGDAKLWNALSATPQINGVTIASDQATFVALANALPSALVRARITLGGTTPSCRLKLYLTGKAFGV